ncbi:uncharacterized protein BDR25DRAFT_227078 [Lindgomyces ingoldianus]|uniref:Uncharacterized protein n=1 Tax=Lindgomyces ingoldianus TaxID=673940 RepID=A0ACB6QT89_9PLEO|nr:uncharacterized protein BDR25DRAFT_227078 [Lindgomyces ingoldianus]KAF2470239.1 hypothetical protein BDR25DRAFT_227078 [Lindgomyces ingoldianus]
MPRAAPSPSPSQAAAAAAAAHQTNGVGPQANSIPMVNGLPSGGQQTDMNHLWSVVQQLSQVLEENRAQTQGIVNGVHAIQARAAETEGGIAGLGIREVNGDLNTASRSAELSNLHSQLSSLQTTISDLTTSNTALRTLITDYESALTLCLDKLRPYAYNQTQAMLALHKHYQTLVEQERAISMQLRLEHAEWQAGLGRVAEYARLALKVQSDGELPYKKELKGLKEENRVLRRLAGWEERNEDSSDEEGEERMG